MLGFLKRKRANRRMIEGLYAALVDRARDPVLFTDFGIDDSFEGRFEALTLHVVVLTRQLKAMQAPAPDLAQDLIDHVFAQFDRALRETGVGDISVPKRMKTIASAFLGRASAYTQALSHDDKHALTDAVLRNVYASVTAKAVKAQALADYMRDFDQALASAALDQMMDAVRTAPHAQLVTKV